MRRFFENENIKVNNISCKYQSKTSYFYKLDLSNATQPKLTRAIRAMNAQLDADYYMYKGKYLVLDKKDTKIDYEKNILGVSPIGEKIKVPDFVHCLIGGRSGAGKSVAIKGLIYHILEKDIATKMYCIDLKGGQELLQIQPDVVTSIDGAIELLKYIKDIMNKRYESNRADEKPIYLIIDELAELTCSSRKKEAIDLLRSIVQLGRACNIHVIAATQSPLAKIIPTEIKINFDFRIGLKTMTAGESRVIIDSNLASTLTNRGSAYIISNDSLIPQRLQLPYIAPTFKYIKNSTFDRNNQIEKRNTNGLAWAAGIWLFFSILTEIAYAGIEIFFTVLFWMFGISSKK